MRRNICKHIYHNENDVPYNVPGNKKPIKLQVIFGFNPIHRRLEICDRGFYTPKKTKIWATEQD